MRKYSIAILLTLSGCVVTPTSIHKEVRDIDLWQEYELPERIQIPAPDEVWI